MTRHGGFTQVTLQREPENGGPVSLPGEKTGHPGLVIAPWGGLLENNEQAWGGWAIVHFPSGERVDMLADGMPVEYARDAAWRLTETGVDWSRPVNDLKADPSVVDLMADVCARVDMDWGVNE